MVKNNYGAALHLVNMTKEAQQAELLKWSDKGPHW